jgi:hypothetical protein
MLSKLKRWSTIIVGIVFFQLHLMSHNMYKTALFSFLMSMKILPMCTIMLWNIQLTGKTDRGLRYRIYVAKRRIVFWYSKSCKVLYFLNKKTVCACKYCKSLFDKKVFSVILLAMSIWFCERKNQSTNHVATRYIIKNRLFWQKLQQNNKEQTLFLARVDNRIFQLLFRKSLDNLLSAANLLEYFFGFFPLLGKLNLFLYTEKRVSRIFSQ